MANRKRKICVVLNARSDYGRIKSVMRAIEDHPDLELLLFVGASALLRRFGKAVEFLAEDGFEVSSKVYSILEGENPTTMAKSTGLAIIELATQFENQAPDVVLTIADRFETIATAVAASYMNIPLAHTQGGDVTGSIDESVRHAVTKFANIHFPATEKSAEKIRLMGEDPSTVHMTGCPSIDLLMDADLSMTPDLFNPSRGTGAPLDPDEPFILVLQHPVTTEYGEGLRQIDETLKANAALDYPTVWLWPNVDAGSNDIAKGLRYFLEENKMQEKVHFYINFAVSDYVRVLNNAACIIGNSSSALREGAFLGVPAVNIGNRQASRERGPNVVSVGHDAAEIEAAARHQLDHGRYESSSLFGVGTAGKRIADILTEAEFRIQKRLAY